jgi:ubiquinone/menaquinone biosynthesis C-methylase UbiE
MATALQAETARARARGVWASGDYPDVAQRFLPDLGAILVGAAGVRPGQRVLDVAAGAGNVAIAAAAGAGADVVALDVAPELLQAGRQAAERRGVTLEWIEGDAAELPFADAAFDAVLSCVGVMFVPDHASAAAELARVCRPGGTIGVLSWTPEGFIGELFRTMGPYAPPPPAGAQPPASWGSEAHVRELFGEAVTHVETRKGIAVNESFERPLDYREYMKRAYGPTIATYRHAAAAGRLDELDAAFGALCERAFSQTEDGRWRLEKEYLIALARRA